MNELVSHTDGEIVSVVTGTMVPANEISDEVFAQEMMGQTIGIKPKEGVIAAPANGVLEVMYPTGHAFAIRCNDGHGLLVHIGINTVAMKGNGFTVLHKQGDTVKAGEPLVKVDLKAVEKAGYDPITMLVVTEGDPIEYIDFGEVKQGQVINKNATV